MRWWPFLKKIRLLDAFGTVDSLKRYTVEEKGCRRASEQSVFEETTRRGNRTNQNLAPVGFLRFSTEEA